MSLPWIFKRSVFVVYNGTGEQPGFEITVRRFTADQLDDFELRLLANLSDNYRRF